MMKRRVVVKISNMNSEKNRTKAMTIAVALAGVESVAVRGEERNEIVVIGERIDAVTLASSLRKKLGFTDVVSVADVEASMTADNAAAQGRPLPAIAWTNDNSGIDYNYGGGGHVGSMPYYNNYHNNNYPHDNYRRN